MEAHSFKCQKWCSAFHVAEMNEGNKLQLYDVLSTKVFVRYKTGLTNKCYSICMRICSCVLLSLIYSWLNPSINRARTHNLHSFPKLQPHEPSVPAAKPSSPITLCTGGFAAGTDGSCGWSFVKECRSQVRARLLALFLLSPSSEQCFLGSYLLDSTCLFQVA